MTEQSFDFTSASFFRSATATFAPPWAGSARCRELRSQVPGHLLSERNWRTSLVEHAEPRSRAREDETNRVGGRRPAVRWRNPAPLGESRFLELEHLRMGTTPQAGELRPPSAALEPRRDAASAVSWVHAQPVQTSRHPSISCRSAVDRSSIAWTRDLQASLDADGPFPGSKDHEQLLFRKAASMQGARTLFWGTRTSVPSTLGPLCFSPKKPCSKGGCLASIGDCWGGPRTWPVDRKGVRQPWLQCCPADLPFWRRSLMRWRSDGGGG